jgi:valyl-tRNA synthetase
MKVLEARKRVVEDLHDGGYLLGQQEHNHDVGHCYRCSTVIEPYLSEQWFVSMRGMADKALDAWRQGKLTFYAKRWENTYSHWLEHIRDWCISRQLWWGHRIPVWYCRDCGHMMVEREDPARCSSCGSTHLEQETDVLDTWFSSWLWPFSTLGWPDKTPDLASFFPTSTLVTGYDIIFFWVSRMIMASLEFLGEVPFRDIYITGLVRDKQGRKMSKSLGNGIDPLEVVDQFGADAMKFTLCYMAAQGQDLLIDMDSFKLGSRFANKMWNATRFLLMNLEGRELVEIDPASLSVMDRWMYHQLNEASSRVASAIGSYRFNDAAQAMYDVFWNDFCDWYVEATKHQLASKDDDERNRQVSVMLDLLAELMRLMHPFVSFITEEIYQKLPNTEGQVIEAAYPTWQEGRVHGEAKAVVDAMQELVRGIRSLRSELQIAPERKLKVVFFPDAAFPATRFVIEHTDLISSFIGASQLLIGTEGEKHALKAVPVAGPGFEAFVFVRDAIDVDSEIKRMELDMEKAAKALEATDKKLSNEQFLANAKAEAIEKERGKKAEFLERLEKGRTHLDLLKTLA